MAQVRTIEVEVFDEEICKGCEQFALANAKQKNAYGEDVVVPRCRYMSVCKNLWDRFKSQNEQPE